ncbi:putative pectinesterase/pectinesterase inhibitor 17 [Bidens hawaiensis]|uniref:putative pectinesterase/pectinesterase inhibitor 17 n=1 Tax=Bidens hawaiensis TaxID=980011 RepID=UPI00404AF735
MTVQAATNEARDVLKQAQGIDYPNDPEKSLWRTCIDYFDGTVFTLNMILDHTYEVPSPDDIHTWLSASLTYIDMCEKEFEIANITNDKLAVISTNLTELLLNSLSISVVITGSNPPSLHGWNFKDKHKLPNFPMNIQPNAVVAKDGSGNFTTVQEAVNSAGQDRIWGHRYTIYVKAGVYEEQVFISN